MENEKAVLHTVFVLTYDTVNRNYKSLLKKKKITPDSLYNNYTRVVNEEVLKKAKCKVQFTSNVFKHPYLKHKKNPLIIENVNLHCFKNEKYKEYVLFLTQDNDKLTSNTAYLYMRRKFRSTVVENGLLRTLCHKPKNYKKVIGVEKIWENTVKNELYTSLHSLEGYVAANAVFNTNNPSKPKSYLTRNIKSKCDARKFVKDLMFHNKSRTFNLEDFKVKNIRAIIVLNRFGQQLYLQLSKHIKRKFSRKKISTIECNGKKYLNVTHMNRKLNILKCQSVPRKFEIENSFSSSLRTSELEILPMKKSSSYYKMMLELESDNVECDPMYDSYFKNQNCVTNIMSKFTDTFKNIYSFLTKPKSVIVLNELMNSMIDLSKDDPYSQNLPNIRNDNFVYIVTQVDTPFNNNVNIKSTAKKSNSTPNPVQNKTSTKNTNKNKLQVVSSVSCKKIPNNKKPQIIKKQQDETFGLERFSQKYGKIPFQFNEKGLIVEQDSVPELHEQYISNSAKQKSQPVIQKPAPNIQKSAPNIQKPAPNIQKSAPNTEKSAQNIENPKTENIQQIVENLQKSVVQNFQKSLTNPKPVEKTEIKNSSAEKSPDIPSPTGKDTLLNELKTNFKNLADVMAMESVEMKNSSTENSVKSDTSFTLLGRKQQMNIIMDLISKLQNLSGFVAQDIDKQTAEVLMMSTSEAEVNLTNEESPAEFTDEEETFNRQLYDISEYEEDTDTETDHFESITSDHTSQLETKVSSHIELITNKPSTQDIRPCPLKFTNDIIQKMLNTHSIDSLRDIINEIKLVDSDTQKNIINTEDELEREEIVDDDENNYEEYSTNFEEENVEENIEETYFQQEEVELGNFCFENKILKKSSLEYIEEQCVDEYKENEDQGTLTPLEIAEKMLLSLKKKNEVNIEKNDTIEQKSSNEIPETYSTLSIDNEIQYRTESQKKLTPLQMAENWLMAYKNKEKNSEENDEADKENEPEEQENMGTEQSVFESEKKEKPFTLEEDIKEGLVAIIAEMENSVNLYGHSIKVIEKGLKENISDTNIERDEQYKCLSEANINIEFEDDEKSIVIIEELDNNVEQHISSGIQQKEETPSLELEDIQERFLELINEKKKMIELCEQSPAVIELNLESINEKKETNQFEESNIIIEINNVEVCESSEKLILTEISDEKIQEYLEEKIEENVITEYEEDKEEKLEYESLDETNKETSIIEYEENREDNFEELNTTIIVEQVKSSDEVNKEETEEDSLEEINVEIGKIEDKYKLSIKENEEDNTSIEEEDITEISEPKTADINDIEEPCRSSEKIKTENLNLEVKGNLKVANEEPCISLAESNIIIENKEPCMSSAEYNIIIENEKPCMSLAESNIIIKNEEPCVSLAKSNIIIENEEPCTSVAKSNIIIENEEPCMSLAESNIIIENKEPCMSLFKSNIIIENEEPCMSSAESNIIIENKEDIKECSKTTNAMMITNEEQYTSEDNKEENFITDTEESSEAIHTDLSNNEHQYESSERTNEDSIIDFDLVFRQESEPISIDTDNNVEQSESSSKINKEKKKILALIETDTEENSLSQIEEESLIQRSMEQRAIIHQYRYSSPFKFDIFAKMNNMYLPARETKNKNLLTPVFQERSKFPIELMKEKQKIVKEIKKENKPEFLYRNDDEEDSSDVTGDNSEIADTCSEKSSASASIVQNEVSINSSTFSQTNTQTNSNVSASDDDVDNLDKDLSEKDVSLHNIYNEVEKWEQILIPQEETQRVIKGNRNSTLPAIVEENAECTETHREHKTNIKVKYILEPKQKTIPVPSLEKTKRVLKQNSKKLERRHKYLVSLLDEDFRKMNKLSLKLKAKKQNCLTTDLKQEAVKSEEQSLKCAEIRKDLQTLLSKMKERVETKGQRLKRMLQLEDDNVKQLNNTQTKTSESLKSHETISDISQFTGNTSCTADQCKSNVFEDSEVKEKEETAKVKKEDNKDDQQQEKHIIPDVEKHITELKGLLKVMEDNEQHYLACQTQDLLHKLNTLLDNSESHNSEGKEKNTTKEVKEVLSKVEEDITKSFNNLKTVLSDKPPVIENFKYCPIRYHKGNYSDYSDTSTSASASDSQELVAEQKEDNVEDITGKADLNKEEIQHEEKEVMEDPLVKETIEKIDEKTENISSMWTTVCTATDSEKTVVDEDIIDVVDEEHICSALSSEENVNKNSVMNKPELENKEEAFEIKETSDTNLEQSSAENKEELCNEMKEANKVEEENNMESAEDKDAENEDEFKLDFDLQEDCAIIKAKIEESLKTLDEMLHYIYNHKEKSSTQIYNSDSKKNVIDPENDDMNITTKDELLDKLKDFSGILEDVKDERKNKLLTSEVEQSLKALDIIPEEKVEDLKKCKTASNAQRKKSVENLITKEDKLDILKRINKTIHRVTNKLTQSSEVIEKVSELKKNLMKIIATNEHRQAQCYASEKQFAEHKMRIPFGKTFALTKCEIRRNLHNSLMLVRDLNEVVTNAKTNPAEAMNKLEEIDSALQKQKDVLKHLNDNSPIPTIGEPKKRYMKNYIQENKNKCATNKKISVDRVKKFHSEGAEKKEKEESRIKKISEKPKSTPNIEKQFEKANLKLRDTKSTKNVKKKSAPTPKTNNVPKNRTKQTEKKKNSHILPKITTINKLSFTNPLDDDKIYPSFNKNLAEKKSSDTFIKMKSQNHQSSTSIKNPDRIKMPHDPRMNWNMHNLAPFQSEYPRKDNLKQIDVEETYLFKLVNNLFSESYIKPLVQCSSSNLKKTGTANRKLSEWHDDRLVKRNLTKNPSFTSWARWKNFINDNPTTIAQHKNYVKKTVYSDNGVKFYSSPLSSKKSQWRDMGPKMSDYFTAIPKQDSGKKKTGWRDMGPKLFAQANDKKNPNLVHYVISKTSTKTNKGKGKSAAGGSSIKEKYEAWKKLCANSSLKSKASTMSRQPKSNACASKLSCNVNCKPRSRAKKIVSSTSNTLEYGVLEKPKTRTENFKQKRTKLKKAPKLVSKKKTKNKSTRKQLI